MKSKFILTLFFLFSVTWKIEAQADTVGYYALYLKNVITMVQRSGLTPVIRLEQ